MYNVSNHRVEVFTTRQQQPAVNHYRARGVIQGLLRAVLKVKGTSVINQLFRAHLRCAALLMAVSLLPR